MSLILQFWYVRCDGHCGYGDAMLGFGRGLTISLRQLMSPVESETVWNEPPLVRLSDPVHNRFNVHLKKGGVFRAGV